MTTKPNLGTESTKPYLLRAIYQWAIDHNLTPQVLVDAGMDEVTVPMDYVKDDRIVLSIHPNSVKDLEMGNQHLQFSARFAGESFEICVPMAAVSAIYCKENGHGLVFQVDSNVATSPPSTDAHNTDAHNDSANPHPSHRKKPKKLLASHFTLVK